LFFQKKKKFPGPKKPKTLPGEEIVHKIDKVFTMTSTPEGKKNKQTETNRKEKQT